MRPKAAGAVACFAMQPVPRTKHIALVLAPEVAGGFT